MQITIVSVVGAASAQEFGRTPGDSIHEQQ